MDGMLTAIVAIETMLLLLLGFLMVGLLRSHAEILRRLARDDQSGPRPQPVSLERAPGAAARDGDGHAAASGASPPASIPDHLPAPRPVVTPASDISGRTLDDDAVVLSPMTGDNTLVAFLSSGCMTCRTFWDGLQPDVRRPLPGGTRIIVVTKDAQLESPSRLRALAPPDVPVVLSSAAWESYAIPMSPFFVYIDGASGEVRSEGAASTWDQVSSLLADAIADEEILRRADA
jgi:hypothetical protein